MEGSASVASSSRGSRGRDLIPLTPEILNLSDRLEPDKGKQRPRLLAEHLTGQRTLPATEEELQEYLERKATREIKRQYAATEAEANKAIEEQMEADRTAHQAAMATHLAQQDMPATLASRATTEEAIAT